MHDRIYHFQHRMLPKWTHESEGKFYKDILNSDFDILFNTASNVVGKEFSKNIIIQRLDDINGIQQFPQAFQGKIFTLHRQNNRIGGCERVDRYQAQ